MDVLVGVVELELARLQLGADLLEAAVDRRQLLLGQHVDLAEGPRMGPRLVDVIGREAPVELDRAVQPPEARVGFLAHAGHGADDYLRSRRCGTSSPEQPARSDNAVACRLLDRGEGVVALVRDVAAARSILPAGIELAAGDVTQPETIHRAAEGIDGVFNCMGIYEQWLRDDSTFEQVNAQGALNVITAARQAGAKRAVHTSTFDVFHAEPRRHPERDRLADYPKGTAYERSKQHAEELVLAEAEQGIEVVIVNPTAVYGPGPWAARRPRQRRSRRRSAAACRRFRPAA